MAKATVNGTVIAESDNTQFVEGNHYFPSDSVNWDYFKEIEGKSTVCPWKGAANYFDIQVDGTKLEGVAWTYKAPKSEAAHIEGHVAFYPKVAVED